MKLFEKDNIKGLIILLCYFICVLLLTVAIYNKVKEDEGFFHLYVTWLCVAFVPLALLVSFSEKLTEPFVGSGKINESIQLFLVTIFSIPYVSGIGAWISILIESVVIIVTTFWKFILVGLVVFVLFIIGAYLKDRITELKRKN